MDNIPGGAANIYYVVLIDHSSINDMNNELFAIAATRYREDR